MNGSQNCPETLEEMCEKINEWAAKMKKWADSVEEALWPGGVDPDKTSPPPDPPFG